MTVAEEIALKFIADALGRLEPKVDKVIEEKADRSELREVEKELKADIEAVESESHRAYVALETTVSELVRERDAKNERARVHQERDQREKATQEERSFLRRHRWAQIPVGLAATGTVVMAVVEVLQILHLA